MTNDLLPDEIYVFAPTGDAPIRYWDYHPWPDCKRDSQKYVRADLVSTPNKPAEVDLDGLRREVWDGAGLLTEQAEMHLDRILAYLIKSGHLATGKGGDE